MSRRPSNPQFDMTRTENEFTFSAEDRNLLAEAVDSTLAREALTTGCPWSEAWRYDTTSGRWIVVLKIGPWW